MRLRILVPYDGREIPIELGRERVLSVVRPESSEMQNEDHLLRDALKTPLKSEPLSEFLKEDCLIVVNDTARATPTGRILQALPLLQENSHLQFIVATGTHRTPTEQELASIFGSNYQACSEKIYVHDCHDENNLVSLGKTSFGTEVLVNKKLADAKRVIVISSVEPHYFAGYTGGRKSLVPGLAGYRTIEQNHRWALSPDSQPLKLKGNPVHDDLMEALSLLRGKKIFSIQTVLDNRGKIHSVFAGSLEASFRKAVAAASQVYVTRIKAKADVVITVAAPPLDSNLYQAHKAIEHGKLVLKKGGTLILVAACREGIGPDHFYHMIASIKDRSEMQTFLENSEKAEYTLGLHKAVKITELLMNSEIYALTEIPDDLLLQIRIKPLHDLQAAVNEALERRGADAKSVILLDGATCVPRAS